MIGLVSISSITGPITTHLPCGKGENPFSLAAKSDKYTIWTTCHGIVLEQNGRYKWVFHADHILTGTPTKLRFPSISKVALRDSFLLVQQAVGNVVEPGSRLWVIDLERNRCAETNMVIPGWEPFVLKQDSIHLKTSSGKKVVSWKALTSD